jgi:hypothetical protein
MTHENTTADIVVDESTIGQDDAKNATDSKIKALPLPADQQPEKSDDDRGKGTNDTIDHETSLVVTEDDTVKPDISMIDATNNNSQATGDVELTANFPQKVMSTQSRSACSLKHQNPPKSFPLTVNLIVFFVVEKSHVYNVQPNVLG